MVDYLVLWLNAGFVGWAALIIYRFLTEGPPKHVPAKGYIYGFTFALLLGPICFIFLAYLIGRRVYDKAFSKR